jgi:hypothetical protein
MMLIALMAVGLGAWQTSREMGILLTIVAGPAFIWTVLVTYHRAWSGRPLHAWDTVGVFMAAMSAVVFMGVAGFIAFFLTCASFMPMRAGNDAQGQALAWSLAAGIAGVIGAGFFIALLRHPTRQGRPR